MITVTFDPALWQVVPKEATIETIVAIEREVDDQLNASAICPGDMFRQDGDEIYRAMLAVAPQPPSVQVPDIVPYEQRLLERYGKDVVSGLGDGMDAIADDEMKAELSEHRAFMAQLKGKK